MEDRLKNKMKRKLQVRQLYLKQRELLMMKQEMWKQRLRVRKILQQENVKSFDKPPHEEEKQLDRGGTLTGRKFTSHYNQSRQQMFLHKERGVCKQNFENQLTDSLKKVRHCRHFLKGFCERGDTCGFIHDSSIFFDDKQKVFLDCVPQHLGAAELRQKFFKLGYTITNTPRILKGFSVLVCLQSVFEARRLIYQEGVMLDGLLIKVRPFKDDSPDAADKCSVFLGGLSEGTTARMIKEELEQFDVKVVNDPIVKTGFSPQVTLRSAQETQKMIRIANIRINGVVVSIRPYVNIRKQFTPWENIKVVHVEVIVFK